MKQNTTKQPLEDSKEGLHTQGEWKTEYQQYPDGSHICVAAPNGDWIADCGHEGSEENESNAELIVKAVNERKALLKKMNDIGVELAASKAANKVNIQTLNEVGEELSILKNERKALLDSHKKLIAIIEQEAYLGNINLDKHIEILNNAKNI